MLTCARCGRQNPDESRFCNACGTSLQELVAPRKVRKTVTVVFSDVTGSTALGDRLDPESLQHVMSAYFDEMRTVLERHGGTVEKFIGDAVMAVFGIPTLREDDALRAVRAAAEMLTAMRELNERFARERGATIEVRIGVNTGEVVAGDPTQGQGFATGDAVNIAARLEQAATPGEILIGASTYRLVRDAVRVEAIDGLAVKGKKEALPAFRLVEVLPGAPGHARRLDSPIVGRRREQARLAQAFEHVVSDRACHLFTVLGSAGIGKSRLVEEFLHSVQPQASILRGRCLSYGEGITFWPLLEALKEAAIPDNVSPEQAMQEPGFLAGEEDDADRITRLVAELAGVDEATSSKEESFLAARRVFEGLSRRRPLVVCFDDVHWAEPTFLDLIEYIADWSREAPILLLCVGRPELLDSRPGWGGGKLNATSVLLEPLGGDECGLLIENLLGRAVLDEGARQRIVASAEGNPLFVEELLEMLIDDGLLQRQNGSWAPVGDLSSVAVPPSIQALLSARLDRLTSEERAVIERASIEGKLFHHGAVAALSAEPDRDSVRGHLMALVRKELIRPDHPSFAREEAFRFRHLLIRDAAYESLPKEARAELHEQFADWLVAAAGAAAPDFEEIVGYHLEQAFRYRAALGPLDQRTQELGARAVERLLPAARRADGRGDIPAAVNLYSRTAALLPERARERLPVLSELAEVLIEAGDLTGADRAAAEAAACAQALGEPPLAALALLPRARLEMCTNPNLDKKALQGELERAIETLAEAGDERALARVWLRISDMAGLGGDMRRSEEALHHAHEHARRGRATREEKASGRILMGAAVLGPTPVGEAIQRCERFLQEADSVADEAAALAQLGVLRAMTGDVEEGRRLSARAREIRRELGQRVRYAGSAFGAAEIEKLAEDFGAAEAVLREAYEILEGMGDKAILTSVAWRLADALQALGRDDEADDLAHVSAEAASAEDVDAQTGWRLVRAKVLARRGALADAEALAREAVELASAERPALRAEALLALADTLSQRGRSTEARVAWAEAAQLYEQKGIVLAAASVRHLLEQDAASALPRG